MAACSGFRDFEPVGWIEKAEVYDDFFGDITDQGIDHIHDVLGGFDKNSFWTSLSVPVAWRVPRRAIQHG